MKNFRTSIFIALLLISVTSFAQIAFSNFEELGVVTTTPYVDLGDPTVAHDLTNNANEPIVNFTSTGGELGFNARYEPYDTPSEGLTDGSWVGVSGDQVGLFGLNNSQSYRIGDVNGNYILEFDPVDLTGFTDVTVAFSFMINSSAYEGNGSENHSESDTFRIYIKDLTNDTEMDIFNPGINLSVLYLGAWQSGQVSIPSDIMAQLVIHVRTSEPEEAIYFDNFVFNGSAALGLEENNQNQFSVYPNPANDFINITSLESGNKNVAIYNVLGKLIINKTIASDRLNISELTSGIYMIKITQNGTYSTKKLVVK